MHTILGAVGAIGTELAKELLLGGKDMRLLGRHPKWMNGVAEVVTADVADPGQANAAISGSSVVYLMVGLKYDIRVWRRLWPPSCITRLKPANGRTSGSPPAHRVQWAIFFDVVYMYGRVDGLMTEQTPFNPCSTSRSWPRW